MRRSRIEGGPYPSLKRERRRICSEPGGGQVRMEAETGQTQPPVKGSGDTRSQKGGGVQMLLSLQEEPAQLGLHFGRQASRTIRESSCVVSSYTQFVAMCHSTRGKPIHPLPTASSPPPPSAPSRRTGDFAPPPLTPAPLLAFIPTKPIVRMLNREVPMATAPMPEPRITAPGGPGGVSRETSCGGKGRRLTNPLGFLLALSKRKHSALRSPS